MTRLVLLNGAPGVGKSTLARRWAGDHPGTLVVSSVEPDQDATYAALVAALARWP